MSTSEQETQFKKYSLEEQYKLFLYGNQIRHPPAIYLARTFAEQGPQIVPFMRNKLEITKDEPTIRDIVLVFSEIAHLKLYDFSRDGELMGLLERKVDDMHGIWRESTLKMISEIQLAH